MGPTGARGDDEGFKVCIYHTTGAEYHPTGRDEASIGSTKGEALHWPFTIGYDYLMLEAIGETVVIVAGGLDISVGSVASSGV